MKAKLFWIAPPEIDPIPMMAIELKDGWKDRRDILEDAGYPQGEGDPSKFIAVTLLFNEGMDARHYVWGRSLMNWLPKGFDAIREGDVLIMGDRGEHISVRRRDDGPGSREGSGG